MAWIKIPAENHPLFLSALPKDPRISTVKMFGAVCAMVNGNMMGGLFARSAIVRLSESDQKEAMALDGTEPFDPMGNGRTMSNTLLLPESVMDEPDELRSWLRRAFDYTVTLPKKVKKRSATKTSPAKKKATTKTAPASNATAKKTPTAKASRKAKAKQPAKRRR